MKEITNIKSMRQQLNLSAKDFGKAVGIPTRRIEVIEEDYNKATEEERGLLQNYFKSFWDNVDEEYKRETIKEVLPTNIFGSNNELDIHVDEKRESEARLKTFMKAELFRAYEQFKEGNPRTVLTMQVAGVEKFRVQGVMQTCAVGILKNAKIYIPEDDFFDPYLYENNPSIKKDLMNRIFSSVPFIPTEIVEKDNGTLLVKGSRYWGLLTLRLENWIKAKSETKRDWQTGRRLNMIHTGLVVPANIVEVIPKIGVIVEYAGLETLIIKKELSNEYLTDADILKYFPVGNSVNIRILNIDIPYTNKGTHLIQEMSYSATMKIVSEKEEDDTFEMTEVGSTYAGKIIRFNKNSKKYMIKLSTGALCLASPTNDDYGLLTKDTRVLVKIVGKYINRLDNGERKDILAQIKRYYKK